MVIKLYTGFVNWFSAVQSELQDWMDLELVISEDARHKSVPHVYRLECMCI